MDGKTTRTFNDEGVLYQTSKKGAQVAIRILLQRGATFTVSSLPFDNVTVQMTEEHWPAVASEVGVRYPMNPGEDDEGAR